MAYTATMTRSAKPRSGLALGGLGAGWFEMRQDGIFYNWSIFNNRPLGTGTPFKLAPCSILFFVIRYQEAGREPKLRLLQIEDNCGAAGFTDLPHYSMFPWLSGVDQIEYSASFPFVQLRFTDLGMPVVIELEAYTPFIPHDVKNSSLPAAFFNFTVTSHRKNPVEFMLLACLRNVVGYDQPLSHKRYVCTPHAEADYQACELTCTGIDPAHSSAGTLGLASLSPHSTYYLGWEHCPYYETVLRSLTLPNIDDTPARHTPHPQTGELTAHEYCFATLAQSQTLTGAGDTFAHTFVVGWHFPNQYALEPGLPAGAPPRPAARREGHYYANFFNSALEVTRYAVRNQADLYTRSKAFQKAFYDSAAPAYVLDQINAQLNTLVTNSWLTQAGDFGLLTGLNDPRERSSLNALDLLLYSGAATAALFPELDRNVMRTHSRCVSPAGWVRQAIQQNFDLGLASPPPPRPDWSAAYVYLALRTGLWSADRLYLEEIWPTVKRVLEHVLNTQDPNGDGLPDMAGPLGPYHSLPMYGLSAYVGSQWLSALAAAIQTAEILADQPARAHYTAAFQKALANFEAKAWNGQHYRLYNDEGGPQGNRDEGCLADQMIGQWAGHLLGQELLDKTRIKLALKHIVKINYHPDYGLRNCTWPDEIYFSNCDKEIRGDQTNMAWSGIELGLASFLLYEGLYDEALRLVKNVDDRYRKFGLYWDHKETGGHSYRALSAWTLLNALLGLAYANGHYTFMPHCPGNPLKLFFAHSDGTATFMRDVTENDEVITLTVHTGCFRLQALTLEMTRSRVVRLRLTAGNTSLAPEDFEWQSRERRLDIKFHTLVTVAAGQNLTLDIAR